MSDHPFQCHDQPDGPNARVVGLARVGVSSRQGRLPAPTSHRTVLVLVTYGFDWELSQRNHTIVRYADDANVFVRSERAGHRVLASLRRFIERRLRLKLTEEILRIRPDIPVILVTGFSETATLGETRAAGVSTVLMKPMDIDRVAEVVRDATRGR